MKSIKTVELYVKSLNDEEQILLTETAQKVADSLNWISPRLKSTPIYKIKKLRGIGNEWYKEISKKYNLHSKLTQCSLIKLKSFVSIYTTFKNNSNKSLHRDCEKLKKKIDEAKTPSQKSKWEKKLRNKCKTSEKYYNFKENLLKGEKPTKEQRIQLSKYAQKLSTLPKFKPNIIPISNDSIKIKKVNDVYCISFPTIKKENSRWYEYVHLTIKKSPHNDEIIEDILNKNIKVKDSEYILSKNKFSLVVEFEGKESDYKPETYIGIDLGLNKIATVVALDKDNKVLGTKTFSGEQIRHIRNLFNKRRKKINSELDGKVNKKYNINTERKKQQKKKEFYDSHQKFSNLESNWMEYVNHNISIEIIRFAQQFKNPLIRLEDLSGIRNDMFDKNKRMKREFNSWTFFRLKEMILYKAKIEGIKVEDIDKDNTSKMCSKCGNIDKNNRKTQKDFECTECGVKYNADFNAAFNIASEKSRIARKITKTFKSNKNIV